jgi:glycerol-3-phosphate dehydrogenase subunit B
MTPVVAQHGANAVDVVVVGAGLAGAVAALRARREGARVLLVARAGGATTSWSGAIDVADPYVGRTPTPGGGPDGLDALDRGGAIVDAIGAVAARLPRHPYARLGAARVAIDDAVAFLVDAVPALGLVRRADGRNHVVATAAGTIKRAACVARSQLLDIAELSPQAVVGVVEWGDLAGFNAAPVADVLRHVVSLSSRGPRIVEVVVPRVFAGQPPASSTMALAAHLDAADHRARALAALRSRLSAVTPTPTHLLTPAMLSRAPSGEAALVELDAAVGCPLRELLSLPPSVPGHRLDRALRDACIAAGVEVVDGTVTDPVGQQGAGETRIVGVCIGGRRVTARALVLASGRFIGGGVVREHVAREALLGLPVYVDGAELADRFPGDLTADVVDGAHPLFSAGLLVDATLRPLGRDRRVAYENVVAAGTVVGGFDPARDGTAAGVALWTGWLAGRAAVQLAG